MNRRRMSTMIVSLVSLLLALSMLAGCAPKIIKQTVVVEKPIEKIVKETVVRPEGGRKARREGKGGREGRGPHAGSRGRA